MRVTGAWRSGRVLVADIAGIDGPRLSDVVGAGNNRPTVGKERKLIALDGKPKQVAIATYAADARQPVGQGGQVPIAGLWRRQLHRPSAAKHGVLVGTRARKPGKLASAAGGAVDLIA